MLCGVEPACACAVRSILAVRATLPRLSKALIFLLFSRLSRESLRIHPYHRNHGYPIHFSSRALKSVRSLPRRKGPLMGRSDEKDATKYA